MAYRDMEVDPLPHVAEAASLPARPDWRQLYEQALKRAEAAEARAEELKWAEVAARSAAGSLKWQFKEARRKRLAAVEDANQARRAAKNALLLEAEVARLTRLLGEAGVDTHRGSTEMSLRREVARLRHLLHEALRLNDRLKGRCRHLRSAFKRTAAAKEGFKMRLRRATAETARPGSPIPADAELRKALCRSRRQKTALNALRKENARLRRTAKASQGRVGTLEAQLSKLRATAAVLSGTLYGRRSEKRETPGTGRRRGQQPGAPGHGRTPRPGIEERVEVLDPPTEARACAACGKPYTANGADESSLLEIEVRAHRRVMRRGRWRRTCGCASSPVEVSAPPVPRLFPNTPYGISVWSRFLFEHYACLRPLHRVAAWLGDQELPVAPGTLADSAPRFVPLFEPLGEAIRAHQNASALRHADETTWRVQALRAEGRSARAWLWTSVGNDAVYFHIDPSRSAEAAETLFGQLRTGTVIVCDRYSAYKKLARLLGGMVTLQFCWAHMRWDFIQCAAAQVNLTGWCQAWLGRIAAIYRLNEARLARYDPDMERQSAAFDAAQDALEAALDGLFARAGRDLALLPDAAREGKALRSLLKHREGLSVFVDRPRTPMDNNLAERLLRGPVIGRRLSFGSDSETGARFTALMYSVVGTLNLNGIDVLRWLGAWLAACADNGGRPPDDLAPWLPWSMRDARRRELAAPT